MAPKSATRHTPGAPPVRTKAAGTKAGAKAFGTKRHRHLERKAGISRKSFGRIAFSGGSKRTSKKSLEALNYFTNIVLEKVAAIVVEITTLSGRKTITEADMHEALRRAGIHVYSYDVSKLMGALRHTKAPGRKAAAAAAAAAAKEGGGDEEEEEM